LDFVWTIEFERMGSDQQKNSKIYKNKGSCQVEINSNLFPATPQAFHFAKTSLLLDCYLLLGGAEQVGQTCGTVVFTMSALGFTSVRCVRTSWVKFSFCIFSFLSFFVASLGN